ncbi:hypothetical protein ACJIZ3_020916 [Penstemon smallii]|uniref:Uncharacterized protein n=1 Tax=Penstemon smallii TaxID=265156 RepID=A0ABD3SKR7_9LAMI
MKKNLKHEEKEEDDNDILKAAAQAWHGHSDSSKNTTTTSEADAHIRFLKGIKPTRFRLEAMNIANKKEYQLSSTNYNWDFGQSIWDSYEIVNVYKKLERVLMLDSSFSALDELERGFKKRKESNNSLRNLFNRMSSRRFTEGDFKGFE